MEGNWVNTPSVSDSKYLYNGKELNDDFGLGWSDYGFRMYDAAIGKFSTVDPLSRQYCYQSPYVYGGNNPVLNIDVEGKYQYPAGHDYNKYKILTKYLEYFAENDVANNAQIYGALYTASGNSLLTREKLRETVHWGTGPIIKITNKKGEGQTGIEAEAYGHYDPKNNTIEIDISLVNQLENASIEDRQAALLVLFKTLIHETSHFADYLDGLQSKEEPGNLVDDYLWYGKNITTQNKDENGNKIGEPFKIFQRSVESDWFYDIPKAKIWIETNKVRIEKQDLLPTVPIA